jgi:hypothetical protein
MDGIDAGIDAGMEVDAITSPLKLQLVIAIQSDDENQSRTLASGAPDFCTQTSLAPRTASLLIK